MTPVADVKRTKFSEAEYGAVVHVPGDARSPYIVGRTHDVPVVLSLVDFTLQRLEQVSAIHGYIVPIRLEVDRSTFSIRSSTVAREIPPGSLMLHSGGSAFFAMLSDGQWVQTGAPPKEGERGLVATSWQIVEIVDGEAGAIVAALPRTS